MQAFVEKLLRYPLPRLLGPAFAGEWLRSGERLEVRTGQVLFHAGSPGTHAYLLVAGQIRVLKVNSRGKEVSLGLFQPGQLFGEYALLPPHQNTASCRAAVSNCLVRLPLSLLRDRLTPALNGTPLKNWLRLHALLGFLREEAFLGFLTSSSITPLLDRGIDLSIKAGNTIQAEGLMDDASHVSGKATSSARPLPFASLQGVRAPAGRFPVNGSWFRLVAAARSVCFRRRWTRGAPPRDGHFVALFCWKDYRLLVGDPASGIQALTIGAFADRWSGHLLLLALERTAPASQFSDR